MRIVCIGGGPAGLVIAAVDGICAGAGAMIALSAEFRLSTPRAHSVPVPWASRNWWKAKRKRRPCAC
jgi:hypothetical protein